MQPRPWILSFSVDFFVVCGLLFATTTAQASAENCDCERFRPYLSLGSLTEEVSDIGLAALHPEGRSFSVQGHEAEAHRLRIRTSELIPDRCKKALLNEIKAPTVQLQARISYSPEKGPQGYDLGFTPAALARTYNEMAVGYRSCIPPFMDSGPDAVTYHACVQANAQSDFANYSKFYGQSNQQIHDAILGQLGLDYPPNYIQLLKTYNSFLHAKSEEDLLSLAASKKDGLSNRDFLTVVQMLGYRFDQDYDHKRADSSSPSAKGIITGDQILAAAQRDVATGAGTITGLPAVTAELQAAGVCRDIATLEAKIIDARGFKNTYTVGFGQADGRHATVVTQDPSIPRQIYMINYENTNTRKDLDGPATLLQEWRDVTTQYEVYKPGKGQAADISSEFGRFLSEAAGFDITVLDPLARPTSDLISTNVTYGPHHAGSARMFVGQDITGARYAGAATDYEYSQNQYFPGKAGIVTAFQSRPGLVYNSDYDFQDDHAFVAEARDCFHSRAVDSLKRTFHLV